MSFWTILIIVVVVYILIKGRVSDTRGKGIIEKYGQEIGNQINQKKISIGMTPEMVKEALGSPVLHEPKIIRNNYVKETLYYVPYQDSSRETRYRYRVIYINNEVAEI